jgi:hypothetical protein
MQVIEQLDGISEFDHVACYYGITAMTWGREIYPPLPVAPILPKCQNHYSIPKVIHYCWFGENSKPPIVEQCIQSWKKYCADWEIIVWNEQNYDIRTAPQYVKDAYNKKMYAFVSDYARLDVVYKHGGFYLDTDVELFRSLNEFVDYKAVFAFEQTVLIATGLGFGSVPNNPAVKALLDLYNIIKFNRNISGPEYETEYFRTIGVRINNNLQLIDDILFLPSSFLCSRNQTADGFSLYELSANSFATHHYTLTWFSDEALAKLNTVKVELEYINERLFADWKRNILKQRNSL